MKYTLLLASLLFIPAALAAESPKADAPRTTTRVEVQKAEERSSLQGLLDEMWSRLRQYGPKLSVKETEKTTVVAGVRGAESTASTLTPYWKGDKTRDPAYVAEVSAFNDAQALAERADYPAAATAFEKFLKDYPASSLKPNAEFGLALAVSGTDKVKGLVQLKAFAEQNRTHPFAADAQRLISQIEK
jgi:TolA-binding protein